MRICFHLFYLSLNKHFFQKYFWCSVYSRQATLNSWAAQMELIFCFTKNNQRKMSKWYGLAFLVVLSFQSRPCVYKAAWTNMAIPCSQDTNTEPWPDCSHELPAGYLVIPWCCPNSWSFKVPKELFPGGKERQNIGKMDMRRLLFVFSKSHTKFHTVI